MKMNESKSHTSVFLLADNIPIDLHPQHLCSKALLHNKIALAEFETLD